MIISSWVGQIRKIKGVQEGNVWETKGWERRKRRYSIQGKKKKKKLNSQAYR